VTDRYFALLLRQLDERAEDGTNMKHNSREGTVMFKKLKEELGTDARTIIELE